MPTLAWVRCTLQGYPTHCSLLRARSRSIPDTSTQLLSQPYVHSLEPLGFPHLHASLLGEHGKGGSWPFTFPYVPLEAPAGGAEVSPLPILCHSLFSSPFLQLPARETRTGQQPRSLVTSPPSLSFPPPWSSAYGD